MPREAAPRPVQLLGHDHGLAFGEGVRVLLDVLDVVAERRPVRCPHLAAHVGRDGGLVLHELEQRRHVVAFGDAAPAQSPVAHRVDESLRECAAEFHGLDPVLACACEAPFESELGDEPVWDRPPLRGCRRRDRRRRTLLFATTHRYPPTAASSSRSAFGCASMRSAWMRDSNAAMVGSPRCVRCTFVQWPASATGMCVVRGARAAVVVNCARASLRGACGARRRLRRARWQARWLTRASREIRCTRRRP